MRQPQNILRTSWDYTIKECHWLYEKRQVITDATRADTALELQTTCVRANRQARQLLNTVLSEIRHYV